MIRVSSELQGDTATAKFSLLLIICAVAISMDDEKRISETRVVK